MSSVFTYGLPRPPSRPLPLLSYPRLVSFIFWLVLCAVISRVPFSIQVIRAVSHAWYGSGFGERLLIHISYSPRRYILLCVHLIPKQMFNELLNFFLIRSTVL